jgi:hypothetical protein
VVDTKFRSSWGGWCSNEPLGTYGVGLWKYTRGGWEKFYSHTRFEVGDGSRSVSGMNCSMGYGS